MFKVGERFKARMEGYTIDAEVTKNGIMMSGVKLLTGEGIHIIGQGQYVPSVGKYRKIPFERVDVMFGNQLGSLVQNPFTKEWWLLDSSGSTWIVPLNHYKPVICHKQKWICFIIPKNGCSSILKSALWYDGLIDEEALKDENHIWNSNYMPKVCERLMEYTETTNIDELYPDYKKFIVLGNEKERLMRWMNWMNKRQYNKFYSYDASDVDLAEEMLWSLDLLTQNPFVCDQHVLPQNVFIEQYSKVYKGMDKVERVDLKDLPEWYQKSFGAPLIKNNVSSAKDKRFIYDYLSVELKMSITLWEVNNRLHEK